MYWIIGIINWFYLLLYLFFFSIDLATKTERELWWWWEHCQGAKDDGSHGKDQRSWHQSQVSMLSSTMPGSTPSWLHTVAAVVPSSPCKESQRVHVQPNSKDDGEERRHTSFFSYIRNWKSSFAAEKSLLRCKMIKLWGLKIQKRHRPVQDTFTKYIHLKSNLKSI